MTNQLFVELGLRMEKFRQGMKEATGRLQSFSQKAESIGSTLTFAFSLPMAIAARSVIRDAMTMEEAANRVQTSFKEASKDVLEFSKTTINSFGIAQTTALQMAGLFGDLSTSMGLTRKDASELSIGLVKLAGDLASFADVPLDEVKTALQSIFTGETEPLRRFGANMLETSLQAYALEKGIKTKVQAMTEAQKIILRYNYVLDKTRNAQGDFAEGSDRAANQTRILQERAKEISTQIGNTLLPMYVKVVSALNDMAKWLSEVNPKWLKFSAIFVGITAIVIPTVTAFLKLSAALKTVAGMTALASIGWVALGALIIGAGVAAYVFRDDIKRAMAEAKIAVNEFFLNTAILLNNTPWTRGKFTEDIKVAMKSIATAGADLAKMGPKKTVRQTIEQTGKELSAGSLELSKAFEKYFGKGMTDGLDKGTKEAEKKIPENAQAFGRSLVKAFEAQRPAITEVVTSLLNPRAERAGRLGSIVESMGLNPEDLASYTQNLEGRMAQLREKIANFTSGAAGTLSESTAKFIKESDRIKQAVENFRDDMGAIALDFGRNVIEGLFTKAFGGEYNWREMFGGLFRAISQAMAHLGKQLILLGLAELTLFSSLGPASKIAAGAALLAASGLAGAVSNRIGQGSRVSAQGGNFNAAPSLNIQGQLVARGPDLVAVFNETNNQFKR